MKIILFIYFKYSPIHKKYINKFQDKIVCFKNMFLFIIFHKIMNRNFNIYYIQFQSLYFSSLKKHLPKFQSFLIILLPLNRMNLHALEIKLCRQEQSNYFKVIIQIDQIYLDFIISQDQISFLSLDLKIILIFDPILNHFLI